MAKYQHQVLRQKNSRKELASLKANAAKVGQAPGTLAYVGDRIADTTSVTLVEYTAQKYKETHLEAVNGQVYPAEAGTLWLNIHGLGDTALLTAVGTQFNLHPLVLEDILNTEQRPKVDLYPNYIFIIARIVSWNKEEKSLESEQLSIVMGKNYVLTFQEKPSGTFAEIRERLKTEQAHIRKMGVDYLVYAMLDKVADRYFTALEGLGEVIEDLEDQIALRPRQKDLYAIQTLRREILQLRRSLWPLREIVNTLQRDEIGLFTTETQLYLHDVYDHIMHLIESMESLRDLVGALQDSHMSSQSHALNQQMRLLTVITTMVMPLTLISSIYGMNFTYMPELEWEYGYFMVLGLMMVMLLGMGYFFWRRRWFD
jgi:magnesium transporter